MEIEIVATVRDARRGDSAALERLARHALRLSLRTAAATLGSREDAADIAQEVAVEALRDLHKLRDPERFDAWVYRITARRALRLLQSQRRRREITLDTVGEHEQPVFSLDEDELAEQWSAAPQIRDALAQLPPRQRLALALRYVAGLTDRQIADVLGCRRGTACSLLSRGRTALHSSPLITELRPNHL
ncbi:MAG TPA: RNA polymerase sigma factor [Gaiellaceae bacterium]